MKKLLLLLCFVVFANSCTSKHMQTVMEYEKLSEDKAEVIFYRPSSLCGGV